MRRGEESEEGELTEVAHRAAPPLTSDGKSVEHGED
jgi:hypothetical protein